jgi:hemerythrin-like metal-binding protein
MAIGIAALDEEHQRMMTRLAELNAAIAHGGARRDIERRVQVMVQEASAHFGHENRQLSAAGYPHAGRHIDAHARLESQLWDALRLSYLSEPDLDWAKKGLLIGEMLLDHFRLEDLPYRDFVVSRNAAAGAAARS